MSTIKLIHNIQTNNNNNSLSIIHPHTSQFNPETNWACAGKNSYYYYDYYLSCNKHNI